MTVRISSLLPLFLFLPALPLLAVDYEKDVEPILRLNCYKCHGNDPKGQLRMDKIDQFSERIGEGSFEENDVVIVPGHPEKSKLIELVSLPKDHDGIMPQPGRTNNEPLSSQEIATLKNWILAGASFEPGDKEVPEAMLDKNALFTWSGKNPGQEFKAFFVKIDGDNVVLRSEKGEEKSFAIALFSTESVELMKKLSEL